ncbi:PEPxxWA-CTERM sorting domain-containing protein [Phenylobacterium sp.]|uniref:PEPxxWA-CTERM sorting domain-containing protein n=1 Tax=Phenylobacterium sp. TaxID=1871053 RepID=UPI0011FA689A|nr:PEPxxWA-CTERM sorting domain-containing protein [Phenylobacterium sp.]THD64629.1 MAG: PEP-CTERM sorting domain-containing protein [Phenylobacterium sp.]
MRSILAGGLTFAAILATGPAFAATVTTSTGFLPTYVGPQNGDLEISSASATINGADLVLSATADAPIGTTPGAVYVWGINTVGASAPAPFASEGFGGVLFNNAITVNPAAHAAGVTVSGDTITDIVAISSLKNVVLNPQQFGISLWPVAGSGFSAFSEFVPGNGTFAVGGVPEPATWGLMILGFGGLGVTLRSRRRMVASAAA